MSQVLTCRDEILVGVAGKNDPIKIQSSHAPLALHDFRGQVIAENRKAVKMSAELAKDGELSDQLSKFKSLTK